MKMEDHTDRDMAVFHQICEVNELDADQVAEEAKKAFPDNFKGKQDVEKLIWTALDHRARALIKTATLNDVSEPDQKAFSIDGDPAAPAFVINEDNIRSQYDADKADKIIYALGEVQLPVRP